MNILSLFKDGRVLVVALLLFLSFFLIAFPRENAARVEREHGAGSPDLRLFYSSQELTAMAREYGPEGRRDYVRSRLAFDLAWPAVYLTLLLSLTSWSWYKAFPKRLLWRRFTVIAFVGTFLDFGENFTVSVVMNRYPEPASIAAFLAPGFTFAKWLLLGLSVIVVLLGLALLGWRACMLRVRNGQKPNR